MNEWLVRDGGEMTRVTVEQVADFAELPTWLVVAICETYGVPVRETHILTVPKAWIDSIAAERGRERGSRFTNHESRYESRETRSGATVRGMLLLILLLVLAAFVIGGFFVFALKVAIVVAIVLILVALFSSVSLRGRSGL